MQGLGLGLGLDLERRVGADAPPWTPAELAPSLWLRADAGTYQDAARTTPATADGDPVGGWADQSGNGRHASQSTAGFRPTLQLAELNGQPVLRFDGTDDYLLNTAFAISQPDTLAVVVKHPTPTDGAFRNLTDSHLNDRQLLSKQNAAGSNHRLVYAGGFLSGSTPSSAFEIWTAIYNGASSALYVNGILDASGDAGTQGMDGYHIGADAGPGSFSNVDLAEMIRVPRALTVDERGALHAYLGQKYGITVS